MTAPIPPGGIVPVPDPISGGAGAAITTADIVNAMWANAQAKLTAALNYNATANADAATPPQMTGVSLDMSYLPPLPPQLTASSLADMEALYGSSRDQIEAMITNSFAAFIAQWFPNPQYYNDAMSWCDNAIVNGGTGINTAVEQALWQRGRDRIMTDSLREQDEVQSTWANRRWPTPVGALRKAMTIIGLEAGRKLGEVNRDIAIKSFEQEIENVKFAVTTVVDQRKVALDAAIEYVRLVVSGPTVAMQLATGLAGLENDFARTLTSLYQAEVTALQPKIQLQLAQANLQLEVGKSNLASLIAGMEDRVKSALGAMQILGSVSSAGINAIQAGSSISGSDSTSGT